MSELTPYGEKTDSLTLSPSNISIGTKERLILRHLQNSKERFNVRMFSNVNNINRTTVIDNLNRLISKGMVKKEYMGNYQITQKGLDFLGMSEVCQNVRKECRAEKLSTHYFKYSVNIKDLDISKIKTLDSKDIKENKLPNFTEYYIYYDDATIVIKLNKILIHIHDIITDDVDSADWIAFHKAVAYITKLKNIATIDGLTVFNKPHYARVESYLSEKLSKIDNKYFLTFQDGTRFWIDYSDKREDETDNALYRERLDNVFLDMKDSKAVFSDVDRHEDNLSEVKEITFNQVKITQNLLQIQINQLTGLGSEEILNKKKDGLERPLNTYFG